MKAYLSILLLFLNTQFIAAQTLRLIKPSTTDSRVTTFDNVHICSPPSVSAVKNKLLVFLPGTGGIPAGYTLILKTASNLGIHAIGLMYQNETAVNTACSSTLDSTCHGNVRQESFDGSDKSPFVTIPRENSIESRLQKLLLYLKTTYPLENWAQYLGTNDAIVWEKIIISGHSQGGGHAGYISKIKKVDRSVMFAASDWWFAKNRPAAWITAPSATSSDRLFGFIHEKDDLVDFTDTKTAWKAYGMSAYGSVVLVDINTPPFQNSHTFYTQLTPAGDGTNFHGSPVVDAVTPKNAQGSPVFEPLWQYMLTTTTTTAIKNTLDTEGVSIFPNPTNLSVNISFKTVILNGKLSLFNNLGQIVASQNVSGITCEMPLNHISNGVYWLHFNDEKGNWVRKIVKE